MLISSLVLYNLQCIYSINIFGIIINVNLSFYITSDRNEVTTADNPINNDSYEDIEGATSNQRERGRKYSMHLYIYKTII